MVIKTNGQMKTIDPKETNTHGKIGISKKIIGKECKLYFKCQPGFKVVNLNDDYGTLTEKSKIDVKIIVEDQSKLRDRKTNHFELILNYKTKDGSLVEVVACCKIKNVEDVTEKNLKEVFSSNIREIIRFCKVGKFKEANEVLTKIKSIHFNVEEGIVEEINDIIKSMAEVVSKGCRGEPLSNDDYAMMDSIIEG